MEVPLLGGFVNTVHRVGDTVRRTAGPWTPTIHALLHHLEDVGFVEAPRALGVDEQGREVLDWLPGTAVPWNEWPDALIVGDGVEQLAWMLRRYHDAVATFTVPADATWRNPLAPRTGELVRHGDPSPFNSLWQGGRVTGLIDWDFAQPGHAITDVAYLARYAVPVAPVRALADYGLPVGLDRGARLRRLCMAYGGVTPSEVLAELKTLIQREIHETRTLSGHGMHPWIQFAHDGNVEVWSREVQWLGSSTGSSLLDTDSTSRFPPAQAPEGSNG